MQGYLFLSNREETRVLQFKEILYIQQNGRKVIIRGVDRVHYSYDSFKEVTKDLDGRFYQCLKYTYVNLDQIKRLQDQTIIFKTDSTLLVGRDCFVRVRQTFAGYYKRK